MRVKGMEDIPDGVDRTPHQLRNGLGGQPSGTGKDDVGPPDTASVCGATVGLQLYTLIIGQGSNKERWFHSPSIPLETLLQKNSCGDALGRVVLSKPPQGRMGRTAGVGDAAPLLPPPGGTTAGNICRNPLFWCP
jgi:hypothetical protein